MLSIVYIASPIDLIPDMILGWGQVDDLVAGLNVFRLIKKAYSAYNNYRKAESILSTILMLVRRLFVILIVLGICFLAFNIIKAVFF